MSIEKEHSLDNIKSGKIELTNIMHRRRKQKDLVPALGNTYYKGDCSTLPILEDEARQSHPAPPTVETILNSKHLQ